MTNVPHSVIFHSMDGFEWGYDGSGPADLALNILNAFVPPGADGLETVVLLHGTKASRTAHDYHQALKMRAIAYVPPSGGEIPERVILDFLGYDPLEEAVRRANGEIVMVDKHGLEELIENEGKTA